MRPVDYHLHSRFSVDSELEPLDLCERAVELGYGEVGFSEHVDFDPQVGDYGYYNDHAYSRAIEELRERFAGRLTILKGIEIDYQKRFQEEVARFLEKNEFDYVIGSVHYLDGYFLDARGLAARSLADTYRVYERETRALIPSGLIDILGHLDYVRRRAVGRFASEQVERFAPLMAELAAEAARARLLLEVNAQRDKLPLPTPDALRDYLQAGGAGVVVGTDSHSLQQFEGGWERTLAYLKQESVTRVALFSERRPRWVSLTGNELGRRGDGYA